MLIFSKLLQFIFGLTLMLCPTQVDAASTHASVESASPSAAVVSVVTAECALPPTGGQDQLEGLRVGDKLQLTEKNGEPGSGGTLEVTVVDANGKVQNFRLTKTVVDQNGERQVIEYLYTWYDGCYYPPWTVWHRYCFKKSSPGIYKYEKYNPNNTLMESGSAMEPSRQPPAR